MSISVVNLIDDVIHEKSITTVVDNKDNDYINHIVDDVVKTFEIKDFLTLNR